MQRRIANGVPDVEDPINRPASPSISQFEPEHNIPIKKNPVPRSRIIFIGVVGVFVILGIIGIVLGVVLSNRPIITACVGSSSQGCTSTLSQNLQDVASDCQQDIGVCSGELCEDCNTYCCGAVFEETTATCAGQEVVFSKVTGCTCQLCSTFQLSISGRVAGDCSSSGSCAMSIQINGAEVTRSNDAGYYTFPVNYPSNERVVFSAVDNVYKTYLTQIKIVDVSRDAQSYIVDDINVVKQADPVRFSGAAGTNISLGEDSSVGLTFMPNSIINPDGTIHTGDVEASINFVDTNSDNATSTISGELSTTLANGSRTLLSSSGMIIPNLKDPVTGNALSARGVEIALDSDELSESESSSTIIWIQDEQTGDWVQVSSMQATSSSTRRRKKRQVSSNAMVATIDISSATRVYNLDRVVWPYCYMKVRIFSDDQITSTNEVRGKLVTSVYRTAKGSWSNYLKTYSNSRGACVSVPCNRDSWRVVEKVYVQVAGYHAYNPQISSATATRVNYTSATNAFVITIPTTGDIVSGSSGPFYAYWSWWQCYYETGLSDNYFRFVRTFTSTTQATDVTTSASGFEESGSGSGADTVTTA